VTTTLLDSPPLWSPRDDVLDIPVTILGAAVTSGAVYLAADSLEFDDDGYYRTDVEKFQALSRGLDGVGVAWYGTNRAGPRLLDALSHAASDNWDALIGAATAHSRHINYPLVEHNVAGAGLLLAGYIKGIGQSVVINDMAVAWRANETVQFGGMYASSARDVWRSRNTTADGPDCGLKWALEQVTNERYGVAKPIRLWRIPDGGHLEPVK
jgi:hypothetical protein